MSARATYTSSPIFPSPLAGEGQGEGIYRKDVKIYFPCLGASCTGTTRRISRPRIAVTRELLQGLHHAIEHETKHADHEYRDHHAT